MVSKCCGFSKLDSRRVFSVSDSWDSLKTLKSRCPVIVLSGSSDIIKIHTSIAVVLHVMCTL
jgi:hypothetical protein